MTQEILVKFDKLLMDEGARKDILAIKDPDELKCYFKTKGLDLTDDDICEIVTKFNDVMGDISDDIGELDENALEAVSGGFLTHVVGISGCVLGVCTGQYWLVLYCIVGMWGSYSKKRR